jgi:hypothetical protein
MQGLPFFSIAALLGRALKVRSSVGRYSCAPACPHNRSWVSLPWGLEGAFERDTILGGVEYPKAYEWAQCWRKTVRCRFVLP